MRRRLRSRIWLAAAALIALAAAACGSDSAPAPSPTPQPAPATSVPAPLQAAPAATPEAPAPVVAASPPSPIVASDVENFTLEELVVAVGTEVTWTNQDAARHTTTSGSRGTSTGIWDSTVLSQGASFAFTFNEVGTFNYFCRIHPQSMNSTVTVVPIEEAMSEGSASSGGGEPSPTPGAGPGY